jgi:hypothetical protein
VAVTTMHEMAISTQEPRKIAWNTCQTGMGETPRTRFSARRGVAPCL